MGQYHSKSYSGTNMSQNVEIWWVCLGERIVVSLSYYLGQYHSKSYSGTRVHLTRHESVAWNREPNGIENKNTHTHTHKKIWNPHYKYPNGIKRKTISTQHWYLPIYIFPPLKEFIHLFMSILKKGIGDLYTFIEHKSISYNFNTK